jgi:ABC-2 type transport system ATP-binding protein
VVRQISARAWPIRNRSKPAFILAADRYLSKALISGHIALIRLHWRVVAVCPPANTDTGERRLTNRVDDASALIEIEGLTKRFGAFTAVDNLSFQVRRGEVLGFLGPNGAGKSTTMRMLAGFMTPSAGTARIQGHDVRTDSVAARRVLGFLPEGAPTYPEMSVEGFLRFCARIRGYSRSELADRVEHALGLTTLQGVRLQSVETLSKGFRRRVGLAQALLHDPPVLVLDEPTDGLDPNQKHEVRGLIERMAAEKAIVISTHILEEVEAVCSRAIVIAAGRIVADATPQELGARHPSGRLEDVFRALTVPEAA